MVNQEEYDRDIGKLLTIDARVRFISAEPLLGPIRMRWPTPDWVIVGGESGKGARPMEADWARRIRDDCELFRVPFHFKQWGPDGWPPTLDGAEHRAFPN